LLSFPNLLFLFIHFSYTSIPIQPFNQEDQEKSKQKPAKMLCHTLTLGLLVQFLMMGFAMAEEVVGIEGHHGNAWQFGAGGGVVGFIVLILDIIVWSMFSPLTSPCLLLRRPTYHPLSYLFRYSESTEIRSSWGRMFYGCDWGERGWPVIPVEVLKSNRPPLHKLLWCVVVFIFPIIGLVIYWLFSNRAAHNSGSGYESIA
jgi:hypothetical protein